MAKKLKTKNGNIITLLNPAEKGAKYAKELSTGKKYTNSGAVKKDKSGKVIKLDKKERAYRGGYLDGRKDNAKAYKAKRSKKIKR
jgi:hypothetical protein